MNCNDIKNLMLDYLDGNMKDPMREEFEKHLEGCDNCRDQVSQFKILNEKLLNTEKEGTPESLPKEFQDKLEREIANSGKIKEIGASYKQYFRIAAGIALFVGGSFFGAFIGRNAERNTSVTRLENEVGNLKQAVAFSMLNDRTVSEKIKAIDYLREEQQINPELLKALTHALDADDNTNVRLAAARALFSYNEDEAVKDVLIKSLEKQKDPMVQIALINFFVENKEKKAVESLQNLINNENTNQIVRQYANNGLQTII